MTFQGSKHLSNLYAVANVSSIEREVEKLLSILSISDRSLVRTLAGEPVRENALEQIRMWNRRILANQARDEIGNAACRFWAAQTIANLVLTASALDASKEYPREVAVAMERGAEGIYAVGKDQFSTLVRLVNEIVLWAKKRELRSLVAVESPLGNTVPTQLLQAICAEHSIPLEVRIWSPPRNDRRVRGRTVDDAAKEFCADLPDTASVILLDDAITGTRFIKLFDALRRALGKRVLIPAAMLFPSNRQSNFDRLKKRIAECSASLDFKHGLTTFPTIPIFRIDAGLPVQWESPVIWGESDLIAGKRKVNLIFTLINHLFSIASDLVVEKSEYRRYLETSWREDTSGQIRVPAPGLLQTTLKDLFHRLDLETLFETLDKLARAKFKDDYEGSVKSMDENEVTERWEWVQESFFNVASQSLDAVEARFLWRACADSFAATGQTHRPRPARDHDFAPYTLKYNATISAFNHRLLSLLVEHSGTQFPPPPSQG